MPVRGWGRTKDLGSCVADRGSGIGEAVGQSFVWFYCDFWKAMNLKIANALITIVPPKTVN